MPAETSLAALGEWFKVIGSIGFEVGVGVTTWYRGLLKTLVLTMVALVFWKGATATLFNLLPGRTKGYAFSFFGELASRVWAEVYYERSGNLGRVAFDLLS